MDFLPQMSPVELLETTHEFPCSYEFKAIGSTENFFVERVVASVRQELQLEFDPPHHLRTTPAGRHVSVTVQATVATPQEVIAVYTRLRQTDGLVMLL